ncbi:hypothetical protein SBOR_5441 [Sclerotinia borealis F-4128]|uniref:Uncharacterized protein n=1 Tax=Sclerotinia borealis (strain F-4128) TaxID=1432307 RepID=W9CE81_SCLBF|nr:hypothetical protein SBOR_5441 [Sclerotinia borealis F-4128]
MATFDSFRYALDITLSRFPGSNYVFKIYDREQTNCPLEFLGPPQYVITTIAMSQLAFIDPSPRHSFRDSLQTPLFGAFDRFPIIRRKKVIHYECDAGQNGFQQYVILLLDREAQTSKFVTLWSGASRCTEDLAGNEDWKLQLKLAYEASESTEAQKRLIFWHETPDVTTYRSRKAINEALSKLLVHTIRPLQIGLDPYIVI